MLARSAAFVAVQFVLTCLLLAGCRHVSAEKGLLEKNAMDTHLSSDQLRVLVNDFAVHFAYSIEADADFILAEASDPAIRQNALRWKSNGISACYRAAARRDPLAAYMDVWILNKQMAQLFRSPPGQHLFGPWQPVALRGCQRREQRLRAISDALGTNLPIDEKFAATFAADYPVHDLYFNRESLATRYIEAVEAPTREMFQAIASLRNNVEELRKLSMIYAEHLPKQARWEAELLLADASRISTVQRPIQDFAVTTQSIARVADTVEGIPEIIAHERHALHEIVRQERRDTLREVDRMRQETMSQLEGERALVLNTLRDERAAVLDALRDERVAVSRQLDGHMATTVRQADDITQRRVDQLAQHGNELVDHFFWRTWQLCAVVGVLAVTVLLLLAWRIARRDPVVRFPEETESNDPGIVSIDFESQRVRAA
jgi:hypothetical protein